MTKKFLVLLTALLMLSLFVGCGSTEKIKNDVPVDTLATVVASALGNNDFVAVADYYFEGSMKIDVSGFDGHTVMINSKGVNIDEFGIFQVKDAADVAAAKETVETYLQMRRDTWIPEYMPEERPKLDSAEIKTAGNYVMYAILWDEGKTTAFGAFEDKLKAD